MTEPKLAAAEAWFRHVVTGGWPNASATTEYLPVLLAEYDRRADRDQLHAALATAYANAENETESYLRLGDALDRVRAERDAYRSALTELRAASRGLAFFDQIKCARWNAAYQQASQVLGLEDET